LHNLFRSDNRRHGIAVSHCFGKNRDVGTYIQEQVNTSICHTEASSDLIKDEDGADLLSNLSDFLQEPWQRFVSTLGFQNDRGQRVPVALDNGFQLIDLVVVER